MDSAAPPLVLVLEDDDAFAARLLPMLEELGCVTERLPDGLEALGRLRLEPVPSLILLDLMLPGVDGWSFYAESRRNPNFPRVPVIVLTASRVLPTLALAGVLDFHRKPRGDEEWALLRDALRLSLSSLRTGEGVPLTYALEMPQAFARELATLPLSTRNRVDDALRGVARLGLDPAWRSGAPPPTTTVSADDCRLKVELVQPQRVARVVALMLPGRGWMFAGEG